MHRTEMICIYMSTMKTGWCFLEQVNIATTFLDKRRRMKVVTDNNIKGSSNTHWIKLNKVAEENPLISQINQYHVLSSNWQKSKKIHKY